MKPRLSSVGLPRGERFITLVRIYALPSLVYPRPRLRPACGVAPVLSSRPPILARKPPSVLSPFAQLRCYLCWGDVISISSAGITPRSSLVRAHVPLPVGSLLLQHLASFEESLQVVPSPCCPRELPDVISENLSLDAGSRTPAAPPRALPCFFRCVIGLLPGKMGSAFRF